MKTNRTGLIFLSAFLGSLLICSSVFAQEDLIGGQDPNTTFNEIFDPVERFVERVIEIVESVILHLFDWEWVRGIFIGLFETINNFLENITGNNLAEIFRMIGDTLVEVFYYVIDLIKSLCPSRIYMSQKLPCATLIRL